MRADPSLIYLDGNSLGPLPRATQARIAEVVSQERGAGLVRSWSRWIELPRGGGVPAHGCGLMADVLGSARMILPGARRPDRQSCPVQRPAMDGYVVLDLARCMRQMRAFSAQCGTA